MAANGHRAHVGRRHRGGVGRPSAPVRQLGLLPGGAAVGPGRSRSGRRHPSSRLGGAGLVGGLRRRSRVDDHLAGVRRHDPTSGPDIDDLGSVQQRDGCGLGCLRGSEGTDRGASGLHHRGRYRRVRGRNPGRPRGLPGQDGSRGARTVDDGLHLHRHVGHRRAPAAGDGVPTSQLWPGSS